MTQLPAGMRNNNPGNIKYVGQDGTSPSVNTDQGDPQAVYPSAEAGMAAMYQLLARKYVGGKITPNMIIAGKGGWTPGNYQAAANVAKTAGIGPDDDIKLHDPAAAARFMRGLLLQEHGPASDAYSDDMIHAAIGATKQVIAKNTLTPQPIAATAAAKNTLMPTGAPGATPAVGLAAGLGGSMGGGSAQLLASLLGSLTQPKQSTPWPVMQPQIPVAPMPMNSLMGQIQMPQFAEAQSIPNNFLMGKMA